jgi:hypothetical protein
VSTLRGVPKCSTNNFRKTRRKFEAPRLTDEEDSSYEAQSTAREADNAGTIDTDTDSPRRPPTSRPHLSEEEANMSVDADVITIRKARDGGARRFVTTGKRIFSQCADMFSAPVAGSETDGVYIPQIEYWDEFSTADIVYLEDYQQLPAKRIRSAAGVSVLYSRDVSLLIVCHSRIIHWKTGSRESPMSCVKFWPTTLCQATR